MLGAQRALLGKVGPSGRKDPARATDQGPRHHGRGAGFAFSLRLQGDPWLSGANPQQAGPLGRVHGTWALAKGEEESSGSRMSLGVRQTWVQV